MEPIEIGKSYDRIAQKYDAHLTGSEYGLNFLQRAINYCTLTRRALDLGCGSGGRMIDELETHGFKIWGVDISAQMLALARAKHPTIEFQQANIVDWQSTQSYDLIVAWDSLFHLPLRAQAPVLRKICSWLAPQGILMYTFGADQGAHKSSWHNEPFAYSAIGITENLRIISECHCECKHLELDQYPEKHVTIIVKKQT
ncbi:MAG: class I SAM-dependent methyltransferase [Bacteroidota bacterium]